MVNGLVFAWKWIMVLAFYIAIGYGLSRAIRFIISSIKDKKWKSLIIAISIFFVAASGLKILLNMYNASRVPQVSDYNKDYVMDINEIKETSDGTKVRINKAIMDINNISFNVGIKGKDKLVALEIKKAHEDNEPLGEITGLWIGNKFSYEYYSVGTGYKSEIFIDTIYVVCYLSSGEEVYFKIDDKKNVKSKTEIIKLSKDLDFDGKKVRLRTLTRGVGYSDIYLVSDIDYFSLKVELLEAGKSLKSFGGGGGGGQNNYSFAPVGDSDISIKLTDKNTGKEIIYKVK